MRTVSATPHRVLVVEDQATSARLLEEVLSAEGHQVEVVGDGLSALARVAEGHPDLILVDLDLARLDGEEVCRQIKSHPSTCYIPIILVTARSGAEARQWAGELGADDFLTKPFQGAEVTARCRSLLRVKNLVDEIDRAEEVVFTIARAVEAKSPFTHGHAQRVAAYALRLATQVGVAGADLEILHKGALLHDVGKISVPDAILHKAELLTSAEYHVIKQHPLQGTRLVEPLRSVRDTLPLIRWHHERLDGTGYPDGLIGHNIPLLARILAVADVYDAMASRRPYRPAIPHERCLEMLRNNAAGGGLDPELVDVFCGLLAGGPGQLVAPAPAQRSRFIPRPATSPGAVPRGREPGTSPAPLRPAGYPTRLEPVPSPFLEGIPSKGDA
jgi:putative two-component system response regulator